MKLSSFTIILIFLIFVITGITLTPLLPFKLKPSETLPSITVSFSWYETDATVIEKEVTSVLEGALSRIRGIRNTSSSSSKGWGNVNVDFDKNANADAIRFEIASIVRQVYPTLPERVSFPEIYMQRQDRESAGPILSYTLNAPASPYLIQKYAEKSISPLLSAIKGIQKINVYGGTSMEWEMEFDADLLRSEQISSGDIQSAISKYNYTDAAGYGYEIVNSTDTSVIHLIIRSHEAASVNLLNLPVKRIDNRIVYIKDIARLQHKEQDPSSYYRINGDNTINIIIYAGEQENQLRLSKQIKNKITEIEKNLPDGYSILQSYDATEFISQELMKNVWRAVLTVAILLTFVLIVTRSFRYLFFIILSLIANLGIAAIFYYLFRMEIHIYSLAGITISLSLIKNNSIVMIDHLRHQKNLRVFMAILAATLTAIAALIVAFFLDEKLRQSLLDFSIIVIINLAVSLFVALFFIPALMEKMPVKNNQKKKKRFLFFFKLSNKTRYRFVFWFSRIYGKVITFMCRFKWAFLIIAVLGFGLPEYKLPDKIDKNTWFAQLYNKTLGSDWYKENIHAYASKVLGGTLRMFDQDTFENSYYGEVQRTVLYANAQMDHGSTLAQMNELVISIEKYLKGFNEIEQFQANINEGRASIEIHFKKKNDDDGFPFMLKEMLTQKAINQGGADWNVYGVGEGFNNSVRESLGQNHIILFGYNYEELRTLSGKVRHRLMENPRIKEVSILSRDAWYKDESFEYVMNFDKLKLISMNVTPAAVYSSIKDYSKGDNIIGSMIAGDETENIKLVSKQSKILDLWTLQHAPEKIGNTMVRLDKVSTIIKEPMALDIIKENQQYKLILTYDYIGQSEAATRYQNKVIEEASTSLPIGYTIKGDENRWYWDNKNTKQYWWLVFIIAVIFFICSVLFESLLLPLAVIFMIPISYIGVFLTFPLFKLNFDQGGFAAFILLSGITVNSALYIINDFSILKRKFKGRNVPVLKLYLKAYNQKIFPIILTILSTTLGLVPFLAGGEKEVFWPALAAGTIGGLLFSLVAIHFFLPIVLISKKSLFSNNCKTVYMK